MAASQAARELCAGKHFPIPWHFWRHFDGLMPAGMCIQPGSFQHQGLKVSIVESVELNCFLADINPNDPALYRYIRGIARGVQKGSLKKN